MSVIKLKVNVSKLNKDKLYKGETGMWAEIVLIPTPESEWGDYVIREGITKEERLDGKKGTILGNADIIVKNEPDRKEKTQDNQPPEELPF